jgi:hypothetical protein
MRNSLLSFVRSKLAPSVRDIMMTITASVDFCDLSLHFCYIYKTSSYLSLVKCEMIWLVFNLIRQHRFVAFSNMTTEDSPWRTTESLLNSFRIEITKLSSHRLAMLLKPTSFKIAYIISVCLMSCWVCLKVNFISTLKLLCLILI